MAWIESHDTLKDHPKTRRLRRFLNINLAQAIGHLHMIWWWALEYAEDGDLSGYDAFDIAEASGWEGDEDQFLNALIDAGFIDKCDNDGLCLHDWHDYAGRLLETRQQNRERQRRYRKRQRNEADVEDESLRNGNVTRDKRVTNALTITVPKPNHNQESKKEIAREAAPAETESTDSLSPSSDLSIVTNHYHKQIGMMGPTHFEKLRFWVDEQGMEPEVVCAAIDVTVEQADKPGIAYIDAVLRNWHNEGVTTLEDVQARNLADARGDPRTLPRGQTLTDEEFAEAMREVVGAG